MTNGSTLTKAAQNRLTPEQNAWRWRILIATYLGYCGYYLCRKVFTLCKTTLAAEFHVDLKMIAHIWTAYLVAYMVGQFICSFVGRKWGPRVLLLGGLGISIAINLVFGFANSYWTFFIFMIFNGLVQASGWPGSVGSAAGWLRRQERGTIMGVWNTNFIIGNMFVKGLGGFILKSGWHILFLGCAVVASSHCWGGENNNWRYAYFGCTIVSFAIWWLLYFWQRNKPEDVGLEAIVEKECDETRPVQASDEDHISFSQYMKLLLNPVIILMGTSYFCLKFLRYALDSWTPSFLNMLGLDVGQSAYYSMIFDFIGFPGAIFAGWALDRFFKGRWAPLCLMMGVGMVFGYILVVIFGANPYLFAICCGLVGFMLYGPDSILCGAAAIHVAGEKNTTAVAGMINGMGSVGPVVQEEVIGSLLEGKNGMHNANLLGLAMSVLFVLIMLVVSWQVRVAQKKTLCSMSKT
jgi:sugar phosphate permease